MKSKSLNIQQRKVFHFVHKWSRGYIKILDCKIRRNIKSFYMTEVKQQRGDYKYIRVLNNIREGNNGKDIGRTLKLLYCQKKTSYPEHVVHMFAETKLVEKHNENNLNNLDSRLVCVYAIDKFPRNITVSESQIDAIKQRKISEAGNLASQLNF